MNLQTLIDHSLPAGLPAASAAMPAPVWFVQFFKVLGFTLHMVPMNLWFAGALLAVWMHCCGNEHGKRFGRRLMTQMPILIAFGINLGIVPLLFLQLAYCKVFYPATILMAWSWLSIIALLIPAYYGAYAYFFGLKDGAGEMTPWKRAAGWLAAILFLGIGFLFVNGLSLMTNVGAWSELLEKNNVHGAALGTALNLGDPTVWPRWLMMFGLALGTTAAWTILDSAWLAGQESGDYRRWAAEWAFRLITASVSVVTIAGAWMFVAASWVVFGGSGFEFRSAMVHFPLILLTLATALAPWLAWWLIFVRRREEIPRGAATLIGLAQFAVLAINAVSRQIVQNLELKPYLDVAAQPVATDWGAMALFLGTFVAGVGVIAWMLAQIIPLSPAGQSKSG